VDQQVALGTLFKDENIIMGQRGKRNHYSAEMPESSAKGSSGIGRKPFQVGKAPGRVCHRLCWWKHCSNAECKCI
jgi:hypothetical protein